MAESVSKMNIVLQQKTKELQSTQQQKATAEGELSTVTSDASAAQTTLDGKQTALSETSTAISNFKVPEVIDEPDRSEFVSVDDETGEEVFDSSGYDAANRAYQESVQAHEEALRQKSELESRQTTQTHEVETAQTTSTNLEQGVQTKTNEVQQLGEDINISISDIEDLEDEITQAETTKPQEVVADDSESEPDVVTTDVPVQNNKGWEYYAKLELEAEHEGEEGYKPSPADLHARAGEIKQRNIDNGNIGKKGDLKVGTPQNPKYVTLNGEIDTSELQSTEQALDKYVEGQEILEEEARLKAEEEERLKAEQEALIEQSKKEAEEGLKEEMSTWTKEELDHALNANDYSDNDIDSEIEKLLSDGAFLETLTDIASNGQDMGKFLGRLAKQHGYKNAQKITGRIFNTIATDADKIPALKAAGKKIPVLSFANAGYGIYQAANGDMTGLYKVADAAIAFIPYIGPVLSLIGTENMVNLGEAYLKKLSEIDDRLASQKIINNSDNSRFTKSVCSAALWDK